MRPQSLTMCLARYDVQRAKTLEDLLSASDYVSVHCPLRKENVDLIAAPELSLMKPTAFLINTARGRIVNESALANALTKKCIAAPRWMFWRRKGRGITHSII